MTYIYLACSINVMVFMICTMGMWIYRMLWIYNRMGMRIYNRMGMWIFNRMGMWILDNG